MTPPNGLTVVVGGGAAGIAAARTLHDAGAAVLLLEARERLGGRARSVDLPRPAVRRAAAVHGTDRASASLTMPARATDGWTVDAGCGWLHSARRNPWVAIAEAARVPVDRTSPHWDEQWRDLGFPRHEQEAFGRAWGCWEAAARAAQDGPDRPLSDFVAADDPWYPALDAVSGYVNGAALRQVSLHDWLAYEDAAGPDNWSLPRGYGSLVVGHAGEVPHRLDTPVTAIDRRGARLRLATPSGELEADRAIVAVPTTVLADGRLRFLPDLPAKAGAAADLPLGLADKVFLHVDGPLPWPAHAHLLGDPKSGATGSYRLSPFGWPLIEGFLGGPCADAVEDARTAEAFAMEELVALLGSGWRARLTPLGATRWRHEAWIGGSYSHAAVGRRCSRAVLAEPVDGRLFFVGEACHGSDFSTAHGAYETGVTAARAVLGSYS